MSQSTAPATRGGVARAPESSVRLQHLRNLLSSRRRNSAESRRALETLDREMVEMEAEPVSARLERRRHGLEAQIREVDSVLPSESPPADGMPLLRRRRIMHPSERLLRRREHFMSQTESMQEALPLNENPPPPIQPSESAIQEFMEEAEANAENRWRTKRRKLDDGAFEDESQTFSYGYKGQVVEAPLRMKIIHCDGGEYSELNGATSNPQHALQDDSSVYCTKSSKCNMLLKHAGGMPFSLTKVVIKAPNNGFDAPLQEGMVFVSLDDDQLLEKTSQYKIRYSPRSFRYAHRRQGPHAVYRPSQEYLTSTRSPLRSIDRSTYLRDPYPPTYAEGADCLRSTPVVPGFRVTTTFETDTDGEPLREPNSHYQHLYEVEARRFARTYHEGHDRYRPVYPTNYHNRQSQTQAEDDHASVSSVASNNDHEPDLDTEISHIEEQLARERYAYTRAASYRDRIRASAQQHRAQGDLRRRAPGRFTEEMAPTDEDDEDEDDDIDVVARALTLRRDTPARVEVARPDIESEGNHADESAEVSLTSAEKQTQGSEPLAPHACFFIRRDKSAVTINFDPPVAGRYMLIKLWAPCPNANIDIQSIIAHGYGGPRFFPCYEMR